MQEKSRRLSLTSDHVAHVQRVVADAGPPPGAEQHTDADYDDWVARILAGRPAPDRPIQLFAYGSLIWKPELEHRAEQVGIARGWHRAFCLRALRFRGTLDKPGLMMVLDRGGQCRGVLYELPMEDLEAQLHRLFRREFTMKPINNIPRWLTVQTASGPVKALGFVMNRQSPNYAGRLPLEEVAQTLAVSCGHWGSGAEYLFNTVSHLEEMGIHDSGLWRLQRLVAEEIDRNRADGKQEWNQPQG
ncbi:gamma-glutamylcyclotransferase [Paracoccus zhejiangensis]|uniref:glutathione-specific gamma-glutamylcyclotransferase n=1 Tax=Paracoccus zhejiangensis TaxID=1077935 RepID=A0A2H5F275_9RHOB|nr:gamma-glutamylcyclotransferase [Paracoccus zhejiangensis]AUH65655.1 gamma-glutamylcyclotransferase [Paracoccus zhejiangensis]